MPGGRDEGDKACAPARRKPDSERRDADGDGHAVLVLLRSGLGDSEAGTRPGGGAGQLEASVRGSVTPWCEASARPQLAGGRGASAGIVRQGGNVPGSKFPGPRPALPGFSGPRPAREADIQAAWVPDAAPALRCRVPRS